MYIYIYIHIPAVQSRSRSCSPAPDLVLRKLVFPRVFFPGGVFFSTDTGMTMACHRMKRFRPSRTAQPDVWTKARCASDPCSELHSQTRPGW